MSYVIAAPEMLATAAADVDGSVRRYERSASAAGQRRTAGRGRRWCRRRCSAVQRIRARCQGPRRLRRSWRVRGRWRRRGRLCD